MGSFVLQLMAISCWLSTDNHLSSADMKTIFSNLYRDIDRWPFVCWGNNQPGSLLVFIINADSNPWLMKGQRCVFFKNQDQIYLMTEGLKVSMTHSQEQISCLLMLMKHDSLWALLFSFLTFKCYSLNKRHFFLLCFLRNSVSERVFLYLSSSACEKSLCSHVTIKNKNICDFSLWP